MEKGAKIKLKFFSISKNFLVENIFTVNHFPYLNLVVLKIILNSKTFKSD